jgi:hypothetical protein
MQLHRRLGRGGSRNVLPEQDLVTFAIWMLGDPSDAATVEATDRQFTAYRLERLRQEFGP